MDMSMQMEQGPESKPQVMQPPYTVELSDSMADDVSDAWTINNDQGSVAEMTCPFQDAEVTARFFVLAGNNHAALVAALEALEPYLSTETEMLDYASVNEGRASGFDTASVKARKALAQVRAVQEQV